ncbi:MAG: class III signal peptide-containing protein [Candidatus Diapherotrites archaeon]|nr:class III signal peptide-containing protein [Candidatus Diapherotrites archaeon]
MDSKAQISIELIVIMAALIVVALVLVSRFYGTSKTATDEIDKKSKALFDTLGDLEKL